MMTLSTHQLRLADLAHGGNLLAASQDTGIPVQNWIDLSTGISPYAYPCQNIPASAFTSLPYEDPSFINSVSTYYGCPNFVSLAGTQNAIESLPKRLPKLPVLLPSLGYQEHQRAWQINRNPISHYDALSNTQAQQDIDAALSKSRKQHLLIINPNNPSTLKLSPQTLLAWAETLQDGGCLIVDEAFIESSDASSSGDTLSSSSLLPHLNSSRDNVIVLRSFGKYFGLAGVRLGFLFTSPAHCRNLAEHLSLWAINGPAQHLAKQAFTDEEWLRQHSAKLRECKLTNIALFQTLEKISDSRHETLFSSYILSTDKAQALYQHFYQQGVLLRYIALDKDLSLIRIGRLKSEDERAQAKIQSLLKSLIF